MKKTLLLVLVLLFAGNRAMAQNTPTESVQNTHLKTMVVAYLGLTQALYSDDFETAKKFADDMRKEVMSRMAGKMEKKDTEKMSSAKHGSMMASVMQAANAENIKAIRDVFKPMSEHIIQEVKDKGYDELLYVQFCPMADGNKGGTWLSTKKDILNPYYGKMMLRCGSVQATLEANSK